MSSGSPAGPGPLSNLTTDPSLALIPPGFTLEQFLHLQAQIGRLFSYFSCIYAFPNAWNSELWDCYRCSACDSLVGLVRFALVHFKLSTIAVANWQLALFYYLMNSLCTHRATGHFGNRQQHGCELDWGSLLPSTYVCKDLSSFDTQELWPHYLPYGLRLYRLITAWKLVS